MDKETNNNISKFLSYILRHNPGDIHIELDAQGWTEVSKLIDNSLKHANRKMTVEDIIHVVETNAKQRFQLDETKTRIRANQGHSVEVHLDLPAVEPPEYLYHGTAKRFLDSIQKEGLRKMSRHDVHLSFDKKTALAVGERHGSPVILRIKALEMFKKGHTFRCTVNNVWLTDNVPVEFFELL